MKLLLLLGLAGLSACTGTAVVPTKQSGSGNDPTDTGDGNDTGDTAVDTADTADSGDTGDTAALAAEIDVTPLSLDFGYVLLGETGTAPFTVSNLGTDTLHITLVANAPEFGTSVGAVDIAPGAGLSIDGTLSSTTLGEYTSSITIAANDDDEPTTDVAVTGRVVDDFDQDDDGYDMGDDCNDADAAIHPGATEVWYNGVDEDCDGNDDDLDGDGFSLGDDCNDLDALISPDMPEVCDGVDNDCDGGVDTDSTDAAVWYVDADGDGFGDAATSVWACEAPVGYVDDSTDCNDADIGVNPDAVEVCNGVDDDCSGVVDDYAADAPTWYADSDSDTFGDASTAITTCDAPAGYVADGTDCDDAVSTVNPDATEVCDGIDNDCDGTIDTGASDATNWYADSDSDSYGDASTMVSACDAPVGYVADGTDCVDTNSAIHPGASELCNDIDDDCDGSVDESAIDKTTWYADSDSDTYGDGGVSVSACDAPAGYVASATDCDDANNTIHPGATEVCDNADNDCDGTVDVGAVDETTWYRDADTDTYGDADVPEADCDQPAGYVADDTDCDDTNSTIHPGATEVSYNGLDDDCDGRQDEMSALAESGWTIRGTSTSHATASVLKMDSDVDGDGKPELLVASVGDDARAANAGGVAFHDDSNRGTNVLYSGGWLLVGGESSGDGLGSDVEALGDTDGDGHREFAIGAPYANQEDTDDGGVWIFDTYNSHNVIYSGTQNVNSLRDGRLDGGNEDDWFGWDIAVGDFWAEGDTDAAIGAPGADNERGYVWIFAGVDEWYANVDGVAEDWAAAMLKGVSSNDHFGSAVAVDDLSGDGWDDLVACAPARTSSKGVCWYVDANDVYSGWDDKVTDYDSAEISGAAAGDLLGNGPNSIATGDLDDDGTPDVAIGAAGYDGGTTNGGGVLVIAGGAPSGAYTPSTVTTLVTGDGGLGTGVSIPGDVDASGGVDLLVGGTTSAGTLYLVAGGTWSGTISLPGGETASWAGETSGDNLGNSSAGMFDLDNDGTDDLAVSASGNDGAYTNAGKVYVLPGF